MVDEGRRTSDSTTVTEDISGDLAVDIVTKVVELEHSSMTELDPPLGDVIDIDALGQLVAETQRTVRVTFEYLASEVPVLSEAAACDMFVHPT
jgi:hypothetical protein